MQPALETTACFAAFRCLLNYRLFEGGFLFSSFLAIVVILPIWIHYETKTKYTMGAKKCLKAESRSATILQRTWYNQNLKFN